MPRRPRAERSPVAAAVGVLGELLITAGALVALFLVWKLWWFDGVTAQHQTASAEARLHEWGRLSSTAKPDLDPVVTDEPRSPGAVIGVLRIPRFGSSYARTIAEGTGADELSSFALGVGHYTGTAMPGAVGNFAIAGHRDAYGGAMHELDLLRPGDRIEVDTPAGRYVYRFRGIRTVLPSAVGVLDPVPDEPRANPHERLITLTTCTPMYTATFRLVAVGVLVDFTPRTTG